MAFSNQLTSAKWISGAKTLAIAGLVLVIIGSAFQYEMFKVDVDVLVANVGALILFVGVLQWLFDRGVRTEFFNEIREEILGSKRVADSGVCDFYADSTDVNFKEYFLSSKSITIGVNYSAKLIDNCISLIQERTSRKLDTKIIVVAPGSQSAVFLAHDFGVDNIEMNINKIKSIADEQNVAGKFVSVMEVDTVLRYSFVMFDDRIWIIVATNGKGRRAVPGFFCKSGPWLAHFSEDVRRLVSVSNV